VNNSLYSVVYSVYYKGGWNPQLSTHYSY